MVACQYNNIHKVVSRWVDHTVSDMASGWIIHTLLHNVIMTDQVQVRHTGWLAGKCTNTLDCEKVGASKH